MRSLFWSLRLLAVLSVLFGLATIVALSINHLRRSRAFWILFSAVNVTSLAYLVIWTGFSGFPVAFVAASLLFLLWAVRLGKKPVYVNVALALLTSSWFLYAFSTLNMIPHVSRYFGSPLGLCRTLLAPLAPVVCCALFLFFRLAFRRGSFESTVISRPRKARAPRTCPKCGAVTDSDAVFCTNCGVQILKSHE